MTEPAPKTARTPEQRDRSKNSRIRKFGGDDRNSWALFICGRPSYTGMNQREAKWRRDRYISEGKL